MPRSWPTALHPRAPDCQGAHHARRLVDGVYFGIHPSRRNRCRYNLAATTWLFRVNGGRRRRFPPAPPLKPDSITPGADGKSVTATYILDAPGGGVFTSPFSVPISEAGASTITSQILVEDLSESVADFTVSLDIAHTYVGDLTATLIAPDGTKAILFQNIGGSEDDFSGTIFDDTETTSITVAMHPFTGRFKPQESLSPLGRSGPNGVWTLEVNDNANFDGGELVAWSLDFHGSWDPLDFGDYVVSTVAGSVTAELGSQAIESRDLGSFNVRIEDPSVIYVDTFADSIGSNSLRDAILAANAAAPDPRTIILNPEPTGSISRINRIPHQRFLIRNHCCSAAQPSTRPDGLMKQPATSISQVPSPSLAIRTT